MDRFKKTDRKVHTPAKPMTFCQWEIGARMEGKILYGEVQDLGCGNARFCFGWKELDQGEIKAHAKYTRNLEQAERFVKTKPRLPEDLLGVAVSVAAWRH